MSSEKFPSPMGDLQANRFQYSFAFQRIMIHALIDDSQNVLLLTCSAANSCPTSPRGGTTYRPPVVPDLQMAAVYAANARRDSSDKAPVVHHAQQSMSQPQTPQPQVRVVHHAQQSMSQPQTPQPQVKENWLQLAHAYREQLAPLYLQVRLN